VCDGRRSRIARHLAGISDLFAVLAVILYTAAHARAKQEMYASGFAQFPGTLDAAAGYDFGGRCCQSLVEPIGLCISSEPRIAARVPITRST
jgi:hypothetical protein